jgi:DNA polymerase-1
MVTGVRPEQYPDLAALRGDASDNLPGVTGFGAKTAVRLLTELNTAEAAFADAREGGERCRAAVGAARARTLATAEARERYDLNREVMAMVPTAELGLDLAGGPGRLPLDEAAVRQVFGRFELHQVAAVRALTLQEPTRTVEPAFVDPRWTASAPPRHAPLPPLVPTGPQYVQEALF